MLALPQVPAAEAAHRQRAQRSVPQLGPFVPAYFLLTGEWPFAWLLVRLFTQKRVQRFQGQQNLEAD